VANLVKHGTCKIAYILLSLSLHIIKTKKQSRISSYCNHFSGPNLQSDLLARRNELIIIHHTIIYQLK
jgi:hypothetical protein